MPRSRPSRVVILHAAAGAAALLMILTFWLSTVAVEVFGGPSAIAAIKTTIAWAVAGLVPVMAAAGLSGSRLAGPAPTGKAAVKLRRMKVIGANGVFVLIPSAIFLAMRAADGVFDAAFIAVQALELAAGAVNVTLLALNMRDGRRLAGRHAPRRAGKDSASTGGPQRKADPAAARRAA